MQLACGLGFCGHRAAATDTGACNRRRPAVRIRLRRCRAPPFARLRLFRRRHHCKERCRKLVLNRRTSSGRCSRPCSTSGSRRAFFPELFSLRRVVGDTRHRLTRGSRPAKCARSRRLRPCRRPEQHRRPRRVHPAGRRRRVAPSGRGVERRQAPLERRRQRPQGRVDRRQRRCLGSPRLWLPRSSPPSSPPPKRRLAVREHGVAAGGRRRSGRRILVAMTSSSRHIRRSRPATSARCRTLGAGIIGYPFPR